MSKLPRYDEWTCPLPLRDHTGILLGHGGGGSLTADLVEHPFAPALRNDTHDVMDDSAVLDLPAGATRLAFSRRPLSATRPRSTAWSQRSSRRRPTCMSFAT